MKAHPWRGLAILLSLTPGLALPCLAGNDLTVTKRVTVGANSIIQQTMIKGARERTTVNAGTGASIVTIRQCDLRRSLKVNDLQKTYFIEPDSAPTDNSTAGGAASAGEASPAGSSGTVTYLSKVTDTGEHRQFHGYTARHLKITVTSQPSQDACNRAKQKYEIDGWYADVEGLTACARFRPYADDSQGCHDRVVFKQTGTVKPGLPLQETISLTTGDGLPTVITTETTELKETPLAAELFDAPAGYREVQSQDELHGKASAPAAAALNPAVKMNPVTGPAAQLAMQQQAMAQAQQQGLMTPGAAPMGGTPGMGGPQGAAPVAAPQTLGAKKSGKIRIGVAPPAAQVGQGNNAGADYSTPIRNAIVALMSGPAVEIAALDSHVPIQLQAEAQQKQCDFILYSSVSVTHKSGGFGKFMKLAPMVTPLAGMGGGMGGAVAAQAAGAAAEAAAMSAQEQAMNQLAGFNGQIKSKDDVTVQYELVAPGQAAPRLQSTLKGKAKSDGEDVLTPLLQQTATNVLTEAIKK